MLGDINLDDGGIGRPGRDRRKIRAIPESDPGFDQFLNLDLDYYIDVKDLAIAAALLPGSTRNFHYPRRIANSTKSVIFQSSCIDASDRIHIAWSESSNVFYTRLDRYGNTLIDDVLLKHGAFAGKQPVAIGCDAARKQPHDLGLRR